LVGRESVIANNVGPSTSIIEACIIGANVFVVANAGYVASNAFFDSVASWISCNNISFASSSGRGTITSEACCVEWDTAVNFTGRDASSRSGGTRSVITGKSLAFVCSSHRITTDRSGFTTRFARG